MNCLFKYLFTEQAITSLYKDNFWIILAIEIKTKEYIVNT